MARFTTWGLLATLLSLAFTPGVRRLAIRWGWVELPNARRIHHRPLPLGGGAAIYAAFWLTTWLAGPDTPQMTGIFIASTLIMIVGLIDDKYTLSPMAKFVGQSLAAAVVIAYGLRVEFITNPFGGMVYLAGWSIPLTYLWLVSVTNLVNFIDGLDGLAAGITAIACVPLVGVAIMMDEPVAALLAVVLAGSVFGFLPYNFNPARLIMGDAGALFLGFMLGTISVTGALKGPTVVALAVPIIALGLPIVDTIVVIIRRYVSGVPVYTADRRHVHHRLLAYGYTQRQAVVLLYVLSGMFGVGSLLLLGLGAGRAFMLVSAVVLFLIFVGTWFGIRGWRERS